MRKRTGDWHPFLPSHWRIILVLGAWVIEFIFRRRVFHCVGRVLEGREKKSVRELYLGRDAVKRLTRDAQMRANVSDFFLVGDFQQIEFHVDFYFMDEKST
ncbi:hypothetical protein CDAR_521871 [Caerostris darwini]|uniref:Uncharacterized protein n=1 Tax=Caerostris darwini TaxID=1538125 RepID=A0AAV4P4P2_9ARAC|nr:hypothetical protein CDAR_521871 [Caerostris darwini]